MRSRPVDGMWWNGQPDDHTSPLHARVFTHCRALEQDQQDIHYQNIINAKLYSNRDLMCFNWNGGNSVSFRPINCNLENLIKLVVDTVAGKLFKERPKATPTPRAADFDVYLRARLLDRFLWGEFVYDRIYEKAPVMGLHSLLFGTGLVKQEIDGDEVFSEVVIPDEILVDQRECVSQRSPSQMHQRKLMSKDWVLANFAKGKRKREVEDAIRKCKAEEFQYLNYSTPGEGQILVIESWKLPTPGSDLPGRHTICIEHCTLLDEDYHRDWFPFVEFRWDVPLSGWYGYSLVEQVMDAQIRQNELNEVIRIGQDIMCVPRVFIPRGSKITPSQFDNNIGKVFTYTGPEKPEAQTWNAFNPEIYQERERNRETAIRFARVSDMSATADMPSRLDSSDALREAVNIEDSGFARQAQAWEQFFIDYATMRLKLCAELYKKKGVSKKQAYRSRYLIQQIDWSEVDMEADKYVLQVSASSIQNMTPAARKDKLNELASSGAITMEQYRAWSGLPDLERLADLMTAPHDYAEYVVDQLLKGEIVTPDPLSDLQLLFRTCHDTYLHLRSMETTPEDILQGFRDFISAVEKLLNPPADAATAAAAQGGMPAGTPAPPPAVDPMTGMPVDPAMTGAPPSGPGMPGMPPLNPMTNTPVPSVSGQAAQQFLGV